MTGKTNVYAVPSSKKRLKNNIEIIPNQAACIPLTGFPFQQGFDHFVGNLDSDDFAAHRDDTACNNPFFDDSFTSLDFFYFPPNFQLNAQRSGFEVIHMQGSREKPKCRFGIHGTPGCPICGCSGSASAVTINQGSEHTPVNITGDGNVIGLRQEMADGFFPIPEA